MTLAAESSIFSDAAQEMVQESEQPFFFKDAHYIANGATTPNHKALDPLSHLTKRLASAAINARNSSQAAIAVAVPTNPARAADCAYRNAPKAL